LKSSSSNPKCGHPPASSGGGSGSGSEPGGYWGGLVDLPAAVWPGPASALAAVLAVERPPQQQQLTSRRSTTPPDRRSPVSRLTRPPARSRRCRALLLLVHRKAP